VVNSAKKANVAFYTIDARGLSSLDSSGGGQGGTPSSANTNPARVVRSRNPELDWAQFDRQPMDSILRPLAKETGGLAIYNTSDFNRQLDEADLELSNYYVLGFQSNSPKRDGRFRELEVKTDVRGATIKHRNGYFDSRPVDILANSKEERSLLHLLASAVAPASRLPVLLRAFYFYEAAGLARIPVAAKIPAASIEIRKKGGQLGGDLHIMGVAYAEDGSVSARFSETQHILLDREAEQTFRKQNLVYRNYFKLRPGKYQLKLAVSDEQGNTGFAQQSLEVPPMPQDGWVASSLVVADQVSRLPDLIQNLRSALLEENDPLIFNGVQIVSSVENQFSVDVPVPIFFKLYNLTGNPDQRKLVARVQLLGERGESQILPPMPLDQNLFLTGKTDAIIAINLTFGKVTPGKYRLLVETADTISSQSVRLETDLRFR